MAVMKKQRVDKDVLTLARERTAAAFDRFDRIAVSFSGGKDSTAVLNLALEEHARRGGVSKLGPLDVFFWDEEAIWPGTIEYVHRVALRPDVKMRWLCLPVKHRNGCSRKSPWWYPWASEDWEVWCRPLPGLACVETTLPGFKRQSVPDCNPLLFPSRTEGTVGIILGIRARESLNRYRSVAHSVVDNWITWENGAGAHIARVKPIYDWETEDVWLAPIRLGWDYNRTYDLFDACGVARHDQRVAPPYGEEPMRGLWMYRTCAPELWDKMVSRVPGAATAARYASTELYCYGEIPLPNGRTWKEMVSIYLARHPEGIRQELAERIKADIEAHQALTDDPIPIDKHHPKTGVCWKFLAQTASRGDLKKRKTRGKYAHALVADRDTAQEVPNLAQIEEPEEGRY